LIINLRPKCRQFLRQVLEHPRSIVAICGSMIDANIIPIRDYILKNVENKVLKKVFGRTYTMRNPSGKSKYSTVRNLLKIWDDSEFKAKFSRKNTLLIESDIDKAKNHRENTLIIQDYTLDDIKDNKDNDYMLSVGDYVCDLLETADDVTNHLLITPLKVSSEVNHEFTKSFPLDGEDISCNGKGVSLVERETVLVKSNDSLVESNDIVKKYKIPLAESEDSLREIKSLTDEEENLLINADVTSEETADLNKVEDSSLNTITDDMLNLNL